VRWEVTGPSDGGCVVGPGPVDEGSEQLVVGVGERSVRAFEDDGDRARQVVVRPALLDEPVAGTDGEPSGRKAVSS
jgi:hypothetical protein